jgi:Xaa-Pro aminopeptidase
VDWRRIDALRGYGGIRIEDDVLVTDDGCDNLTRGAAQAA